jgi:integrase
VHPIQGDELRALRRLQREQPPGPYMFCSERGGPIAAKSFHTLIWRFGERVRMAFPIHPHMLRHAAERAPKARIRFPKRCGVDPSTVQRIGRPFEDVRAVA